MKQETKEKIKVVLFWIGFIILLALAITTSYFGWTLPPGNATHCFTINGTQVCRTCPANSRNNTVYQCFPPSFIMKQNAPL